MLIKKIFAKAVRKTSGRDVKLSSFFFPLKTEKNAFCLDSSFQEV